MRERALLVEGRLSIESQPGKGTEVRLTVPLHGVSA
jgi:signal transduction histidine kinase